MQTRQGDSSALAALFGHNTWANLRLLDFCETLGDAQLAATTGGVYGSIRDTLRHYTYSEVDYVNLVSGKWPEVMPSEEELSSFAVLRAAVRWAGAEMLNLAVASRADTIVRVERPGEPIFEYPLSSFIAQFLNHSTEHRTQISTIITTLGLEPPSMTGWAYMHSRGEFHEYPAE